jgi:hypothetical protein
MSTAFNNNNSKNLRKRLRFNFKINCQIIFNSDKLFYFCKGSNFELNL